MSATESPWIKDVTDDTFEQDVIEASQERPVVVDFWAEWCQPCLMLKPQLEKAAVEQDGQFVLAKCNTSETPKQAGAFQVQGIPAVFAVFQGEVVDHFTGLLPPPALEQWLGRLSSHGKIGQAAALEATDLKAAEAMYDEMLDEREDFAPARIGLARVLLAQGDEQAAVDEIAKLERRGFLEPEAEKILADIKLKGQDGPPDDLEGKVEWADAVGKQGNHQVALEQLLSVIEQQRDGAGELARLKMIDIFKALGDDNELTSEYRRRLSSLLF